LQKIEHLFILRSFSADYYSLIIQIPTTFKLSAISNMSVSMIHTIAFAKWFLNKHRASGILVDGTDFEFILSQLDQSSWDEFIATSDSIAISKTTADTLIPQLVEKMPKKPRVKKDTADQKKEPKPKGKKTKVDAQTSTDTNVNDTPVLENGEAVVEQPILKKEIKKRAPKAAKKIEEAVVPANTDEEIHLQEQPILKKEIKKRAPKAAKKIEEVVVALDVPVQEDVVVAEQQPLAVPMKKEVKKRAPKASKKIEEDVPVQEDVVTEQPIAVPMKKEVKKRAPKAAKKIEEDVPVQEDVVTEQPLDVPMKKEVKKRGPKAAKMEDAVENDGHKQKSIVVPDDVVIPINEQSILGADLQEDIYQDDVELTEVFIDDVLFYKDVNGSWFDALLNPTLDPTL
jgi:hypothetical protein